jgi:protocatechuate 3,4-dioxygenase beta subunit
MMDRSERKSREQGAWTRRDALTLLGAGGAGLWLTHVAAPARAQDTGPRCIVRPDQIEGPYFVEEKLCRSDIRVDPATGRRSPGIPLTLIFQVFAAAGPDCAPLPGVTVDVWHADARGFYSDVEDPSFNTLGHRFLRGYQVTDAQGLVRFRTIYPGSYAGRAVHAHFKVHYPLSPSRRGEFTSQVYFDEAVSRSVLAQPPYSTSGGAPLTPNEEDLFYHNDGGSQLLLDLVPKGDGYQGFFDLGLQAVFPE